MNRRGPSLSWQILAGTTVVLALTLLMSCGLLYDIATSYQHADRTVQALTVFRQIQEATRQLRAERGPANALLGAEHKPDGVLHRTLALARAETDAALDAMVVAARAAEPEFGQTVAPSGVARVRARLGLARQSIDELVAVPLVQRSPERLAAAIGDMFEAVNVTTPLVEEAIANLSAKEPGLARTAFIAQVLSDLHEQAGRAASSIVPYLIARQPLTQRAGMRLTGTIGRIEELWQLVRHLTERGASAERLAEVSRMIDTVYFAAGLPYLEASVVALNEGTDTDLRPSAFLDRYVPTMAPIEQLRTAFLDLSEEDAKQERSTALVRLGLVAALTIVVGIINFGLIFAARTRVLQPLMRARDHVIALAEGRDAEVAPIRGSTEMRRLFDALGVLNEYAKEWRRQTEDLRVQAETDGLTGLANRQMFDRIGIGDPVYADLPDEVGLIMLDLDHFKAVNDRYGHPVGDRVLRHVARRIGSLLSAGDVASRYGGEEIAIVTSAGPGRATVELAEILRRAISHTPVKLDDGSDLWISASFGVAGGRRCADTWAGVIAAADEALYRAKMTGRNRVVEFTDNGSPPMGPAMVA